MVLGGKVQFFNLCCEIEKTLVELSCKGMMDSSSLQGFPI